MLSKKFRIFLCAAAATVLGALSTGAQATNYGVTFDPFSGVATLDFSCPDNCNIDLLTADIVSTVFPGEWVSGFQGSILIDSQFLTDGNGNLLAFDSSPLLLSSPLTLLQGVFPNDIPPCTTPSLKFTETPSTDELGNQGYLAELVCADSNDPNFAWDTATYRLTNLTTVPEPGTLALILGGVGAAWLTRRRKAVS